MSKAAVVIIGILSLFVLGMASPAFADEKAGGKQAHTMPSLTECKDQCLKCSKVCEQTLSYCLKKGGKHASKQHLNDLKDCIASCKLSFEYLSRQSSSHTKSCGFCGEICKTCAVSCEAFGDDKQMKDCAAECRKCSAMCIEMSKMDMSK